MAIMSPTAIRVRIFISILIALLFTTIPLPEIISPYRPLFIPLVVLYWSIFYPLRFTLLMAFLAGLALEASQTLVFGQTAIGLICICMFALSNHRRIQLSAFPQQLLTVTLLLLFFQFLQIWIETMIDRPIDYTARLVSVLSSVIIWPGIIVFISSVIMRQKNKPDRR